MWRYLVLGKQMRDELLTPAGSQLTLMSFLKFDNLTEPTHRIPHHADGKPDFAIHGWMLETDVDK
jgi:hypothetical protein